MDITFWSENVKRIDYSVDLGEDRSKLLEWVLGKQGGKVWTGFVCLRKGTSGRLL